MKYCPKCKLRMPTEATVCRQCGATLRSVGSPGAAAGDTTGATPAPEGELTMQLQGLQHEVQRSRSRMILAGISALALSVLLVALLAGLHFYHLLQYAEVAQVEVQLAKGSPGEAEIKFVRRHAGKVEFVREAAGLVETLIDHGNQESSSQSPERQFLWAGSGGEDFTIRIRSRDGWTSEERIWVARGGKVERAN